LARIKEWEARGFVSVDGQQTVCMHLPTSFLPTYLPPSYFLTLHPSLPSSLPPSPSLPPFLPRYLQKKTRGGRWQKRWFETNGCFLTYYKVRRGGEEGRGGRVGGREGGREGGGEAKEVKKGADP